MVAPEVVQSAVAGAAVTTVPGTAPMISVAIRTVRVVPMMSPDRYPAIACSMLAAVRLGPR